MFGVTFSELAQTLFPYCGGGQNRSDFVLSLIKNTIEGDDDKIDLALDDMSSDYLGRLFGGMKDFPQKTAAFVLGQLNKEKFGGYIANLSDDAIEGLRTALIDKGVVVPDKYRVPAKCADILAEIMTDSARKPRRRSPKSATECRSDKLSPEGGDVPDMATVPPVKDPKSQSLTDVFEDAIDKHCIAQFVDVDFLGEPFFVNYAMAVDAFVEEMRQKLRRFRRNQDAIYRCVIDFVNTLDYYNEFLSNNMFSDDGVVSHWVPQLDIANIRQSALGYRKDLNRLYGLISGGGSLSVFGFDSSGDEPVDKESKVGEVSATSVNTQVVTNPNIGYQFGNNNKQIIGNVETLIINND